MVKYSTATTAYL
jgi:hypothetical protein